MCPTTEKMRPLADDIERARSWIEEARHVSALTGEGLDRLDRAVADHLDARSCIVEVTLPLSDGRSAAAFRNVGQIRSERIEEDRLLVLELRLAERELGALRHGLAEGVELRVLEEAAEPYFRGEVNA